MARFAHLDLVWIEEAYGLAAARELLRGKELYREIWFDKPPLYAWFYSLCGGFAGGPLRIIGSIWIALCGASICFAGQSLWSWREGLLAACLSLVYLTFWIPSAVMAIAPDLLLVVPHAVAIGLAVRGQSFAAGMASGVGLLCNSKALFVVAAVLLWTPSRLAAIGGCAAVQASALLIIPAKLYWEQVWLWGFRYSSATFVDNPVLEGLRRTAGWAWFHAAAVAGTAVYFIRERNWRIVGWAALALAGTIAGSRFFPRYYFLLLPVIALAGARGVVLLRARARLIVLLLLLIPMVRFGPRYAAVAWYGTAGWADAALMEDSRQVAGMLSRGCKLLVWGYRPDMYVFSGCEAASPFLDSQPLTGVIADRHLTDSTATYPELASKNRRELTSYRPEFIVDGLGVANPSLAIERYADLNDWLAEYERVGQTNMSIVYRRRTVPDGATFLQKR